MTLKSRKKGSVKGEIDAHRVVEHGVPQLGMVVVLVQVVVLHRVRSTRTSKKVMSLVTRRRCEDATASGLTELNCIGYDLF